MAPQFIFAQADILYARSLRKRTFTLLAMAAGGTLFISVGKDLASKDHPGIGACVLGGLILLGGVAFRMASLWLFCVYCFGDFLRVSAAFQALALGVQLTPEQKLSLAFFTPSRPLMRRLLPAKSPADKPSAASFPSAG
jgi:hypothetical protein